MSTDSVLGNAEPPAWSAPDSLGHAVWRRHTWASSIGRQDPRFQARLAGMVKIHDRHLAFVRRMLGAGDRHGSSNADQLPIVIGRRSAAATRLEPPRTSGGGPALARARSSAHADFAIAPLPLSRADDDEASTGDPGANSIARVAGHGGSPDPLAPPSDPLPVTSQEHSVQTASPPDASPVEAADSQRGDEPQGRSPGDSQVMPPALSRLQPNSVMRASAIASGTGVANGAAMPFAVLERMASPQFVHSTRDIEPSSGAADAPSTPMTLAIGTTTSAPLAAPESPSPHADSTRQVATPPFTVQQGSVLASRQGSSIATLPIDLAATRTVQQPGTHRTASVPGHTVNLAATMGTPLAHVTAQASPGIPSAATPPHGAAPHVAAQTSARHDAPVHRDTVGDAATMAAPPASALRSTSRAEMVHVSARPDSHWRGELAQLTLPRRSDPDVAAPPVQSVQRLVDSPVSSQSAHSSVATAAVDSPHVQAQTGDPMDAPGGAAAATTATTATEEQTPAPLASTDRHVQAAPAAPSAMAYAGPVVGGISGTGSLARAVKTDASASVTGKREVSLLDALPASVLARSPGQASFVDAARVLAPNRVSTPTSTHAPIDAPTPASTASLIHSARALDSTATETVASAARPTGTRASATSRVVDASGAEAGPALELTDLAARPHASMNLPPAPAGLAAATADPQRIALHSSADDVASQGQRHVATITDSAQGGESTPASVVRGDAGAVSRGRAAMQPLQPLQHLARNFSGITTPTQQLVAATGRALELVSTRQPNTVDRSRIDAAAIVDRAFRNSASRAMPFGAAADAASDFPLVTAAAVQRHVHETLDRAPDAGPSSSGPSPEQAYGVIPMPAEAASDLHATNRPHEAGTAAGQAGAGIDMDEIVERALQALMLRLDIERERRGFARWA